VKLFLSQSPPTSLVRPWSNFKVEGVMVSAFEFFISRRLYDRAVSKGIQDVLDFDGEVMLDSGGFQLSQGQSISYDADDLARFAKLCGANYCVSLDYLPKPGRAYREIAKRNYRNFVRMRAKFDEVIPVAHAPRNLALLELKYYAETGVSYLAIGGMVGLARGTSRESIEAVEQILSTAKVKRIHMLGLFGSRIIRRFEGSIHSADFGGWRTAAAVGYILLPTGYRKITSRNRNGHAPRPSGDEVRTMLRMCRDLRFERQELVRSFASRAMFNALTATRYLRA
jgi:7-cyano-7-deazaguanine tRNA-ribosyltransferase